MLRLRAEEKRVRHPEKAHKPDTEVMRKPEWIRVKAPTSKGYTRPVTSCVRTSWSTVLRRGGLPEYRRVLGQEARDLHDHG